MVEDFPSGSVTRELLLAFIMLLTKEQHPLHLLIQHSYKLGTEVMTEKHCYSS
jgi:hypothetical protein